MQVHEELSAASHKAVDGYITVACFLVREGADWSIKNEVGLCPKESLPPDVVSLITTHTKNQ